MILENSFLITSPSFYQMFTTVVTVWSALVAVLLGQFLVYYRQQRTEINELVAILERINEIDSIYIAEAYSILNKEDSADGTGEAPELDIGHDVYLAELPYRGAMIWRLRNRLEDAHTRNYSKLSDETNDAINELLDTISILSKSQLGIKPPHPETTHDNIQSSSKEALLKIRNNRYLNIWEYSFHT